MEVGRERGRSTRRGSYQFGQNFILAAAADANTRHCFRHRASCVTWKRVVEGANCEGGISRLAKEARHNIHYDQGSKGGRGACVVMVVGGGAAEHSQEASKD